MARAMKDSGIAWIGEIPEEWGTRRLRYLCRIATGNQDTQDNNPDGIYPFYVRSPIVERSNSYTFDGPAILMAGDGVGAGKVFHFVDGKYACHQRVYSLHNIVDIDRRFLYYYLQNRFYISIETANSKSTVDSVRLNMLQDFPVMMPDTSEQFRIAQFLDTECARIDAVIEQTRASIEEYKKLKQAVITQAVTKGIRPNRPMKDSRIDWIGSLPEDWIIIKAKYCVEISNGTDPKTEGDIPVYGSGAASFKTCGEYKEGPCVLIGRKGATLHIPHYIEGKYWNVDTAFDVKAKQGYNLKYYYYAACCFDYKLYISQTTLPGMTQTNYDNMSLPCPSFDEQQEIVDYLDEKARGLDLLIQKKEQLLNDLETYKKSMIFEYVTGKKSIQEVF